MAWFHLLNYLKCDFVFPILWYFQAYGSGCDVVILASDFECVQIIPGAQNGNIQVGCVECSHQLGRVSVKCSQRHTPTHSFSFFVLWLKDFINYAERKEVHFASFAFVFNFSCSFAILLSCTTPHLPFSCGSDCAKALMGWVMLWWWTQLFIFRLLHPTETQSASLNLFLSTQINATRWVPAPAL